MATPGSISHGPAVAVTKLRPPRAHRGLVARPRLFAALDAATEAAPVTLVSAPAGYGKTTALAAWVHQCPQPVAWLSLDEHDAAPATFVRHLVAAVARLDPSGAAQVAGDEPDAAFAALVNLLDAASGPQIWVLDDLHTVEGPETLEAVRRLVEWAPPALRLVLATRVDPGLPLARWRLQGALAELRAEELRFDAGEAGALLDGIGVTLDADTLAMLVARTEGWGAGLQLAALSLRGRRGEGVRDFVERFTGRDRHVLAYLTEEVLQRLDPATHDFLLMVSVLEAFDAGTAAAVTERSDAFDLLAELERANLFLSRTDDPDGTYRFHPFFRDLLLGRLNDLRPRLPALLRERAAAHHRRAPAPEAGAMVGAPPGAPLGERLSGRELEALRWLATGAANKAIARRMGLSPNTVKTHLKRLFDKLGARSRTQAVAVARERGLI